MLNGLVSLSISFTHSLPHGGVVVTVDGSRKADTPLSNHDPRTAVQLRTALKRLKEIMEGKSQVRFITTFLHSISQSVPLWDSRKIMIRSVARLTWLPAFRTVTWSSTGCQTASVKNVMTAMKSSPLSAAATIADCVVRFSAAAAATRKSLESSWVTQVSLCINYTAVNTLDILWNSPKLNLSQQIGSLNLYF